MHIEINIIAYKKDKYYRTVHWEIWKTATSNVFNAVAIIFRALLFYY